MRLSEGLSILQRAVPLSSRELRVRVLVGGYRGHLAKGAESF